MRDVLAHAEVDTTDIYVTARMGEMRSAVESLSNVAEFHHGFTGTNG